MPPSNVCWGIELGAGALKALKLEVTSDGPRVADYAVIPHARSLSDPEVDAAEVKRVALGRLLAEHDLSKAAIAVSVPGHAAFARFTALPPVEPKKVPDIVKFEAVQQIPFPLEDVEWDYQTFVSPDSPKVEVGIYAITKERINQELETYADVGLTPDVVTLSPVAVYNAMAHDLELTEESAGTILLDVGATATDLIVAEKGRVWIRTFPLGGHEFTNALIESFKLSYAKAEKLKREAEQSKHARHIFQAMRTVFTDLAQDVQRSVGYYQTLHSDADLQRLIGFGSTFQLPGLRKYLKQQIGMNVYRMEQFKQLTIDGPEAGEFEAMSGNLATVYGLALQGIGMSTLEANLMPVDTIKRTMWKGKAKWFATAAGLALAATGAMFVRPFLDQNALDTVVAPVQIAEALREANDLRAKAMEAGVTEAAQNNFDATNIIASLEDRTIVPKLMEDVAALVATGGDGSERLYSLTSLDMSYEYSDGDGTSGGDPFAGSNSRSPRGTQPGRFDPPANEGINRGRGPMAPVGPGGAPGDSRFNPDPSGGFSFEAEPTTEETGPQRRVRLVMNMTTSQTDDVAVLFSDTLLNWLRENGEREGVPYRLELVRNPTDTLQEAEGRGNRGRMDPRSPAREPVRNRNLGQQFPQAPMEMRSPTGRQPGVGRGGPSDLPPGAEEAQRELERLAPIEPPVVEDEPATFQLEVIAVLIDPEGDEEQSMAVPGVDGGMGSGQGSGPGGGPGGGPGMNGGPMGRRGAQ
ncbi:MAG: type IV pilus assembly protein PilM [Planctomycetota bacterium]